MHHFSNKNLYILLFFFKFADIFHKSEFVEYQTIIKYKLNESD